MTISMDEEIDEQEEITLHEAIPDENVNVEESAMLSYRIDKMYEAIAMLPEDEADLIYALYLNKPVMTEREYSEKTGISKTQVNVRKKKILIKLKKTILNFCFFEKISIFFGASTSKMCGIEVRGQIPPNLEN